MHIITCASSKGGVGKSTTCVCLAGAFAKAGDTVHIIDLDSNGTVSRWLGDDSLRPRAPWGNCNTDSKDGVSG